MMSLRLQVKLSLPIRSKIFLCSPSIRTGSEVHPVSNTVAPGTKWLRCEFGHSPPSSAQVKNGCCDTSTSLVCLHGLQMTLLTFSLQWRFSYSVIVGYDWTSEDVRLEKV